MKTVDWNHIGYRAWQCAGVLAAVVAFGCIAGMLGDGPTP